MRSKHLSLVPVMLALFVGVMSMSGTTVYDIHARGIGIVDVGYKGASAATDDLAPAEQPTVLTRFLDRMRFMATSEDGFIAAELLGAGFAQDIKSLKQRAADILASMQKTEAELADPKLSAEARAKANEELTQLETMATETQAAIERAKQRAAFRQSVDAVPDPDQRAADRAAGAAHVQVTDRAEEDPKRGFKSHREFMATVMNYGMRGKMDPRLKPLATAGSDEQGEYSNPHGGFLIPSGFSPDILAVAAEADPTAGLTRPLPMDAPMVKVNARVDKNHSTSVSGGLRVYRHAETTDATSSRMAFEQLTFQAEDLIGLAHATENQITDSPGSFVAMIADGFRDEFAAKLLAEKISGTGAGGQYLGVLNSPAKIEVSKESGQKADTIMVENIDKMAARCWRYVSDRTVWLANPTTRPQLRGLVRNVGTGGSVVSYFTNEGGDERLDGRRIFFTEFASALGDAGDLILVNLSEYIEGLYQPLQQAESVHVRFAANERSFKFWVRNCGMPWWSSVLTPRNGDTLSPIVTLAAR